MPRAGGRARFPRAAALVVASGSSLLSPTAAFAQDESAAPPSPVVAESPAADDDEPAAAPAPSPPPSEAPPAPAAPRAAAPRPPATQPAAPTPPRPAAPTPAAPPKAEAPAPTTVEVDKKTLQLEREVRAALAREPTDARRLEETCGGWQPKKVFDERPVLGALLPLCLARAAQAQGRDDVAEKKLEEALAALRALPVDGDTLELRAEVLFRRAELVEASLAGLERCGTALGLRRLASFEARALGQRLEEAAGAYQEVVRSGPRRWARRALLRTAGLYERFYREVAGTLPKTYVGASLPSPFHVEALDAAALLEPALAPQVGAWPREIARVYEAVREELARTGEDPKLLADVETRQAAFRELTSLPPEGAENPWAKELRAGVLRHSPRGFEERTDEGTWRVLDEAEGRRRVDRALAGGVRGVESAWALVALASAGVPAELSVLEEALASDDERVRLAALAALAAHPRPELYEALVKSWQAVGGNDAERLFPTLQRALFGPRELVVVALRALADRERDLAGKLADEPRLPPVVRAYLLAELGDNRLLPYYQKLAQGNGPTTTAVALYGAYLAAGRRVIWSLRPNDPDPVGCVSRHLKALDDRSERLQEGGAP